MSKEDNIIRLDEAQLREHLDRKITESVEDTLNGLLDAEADRLCGAGRYEHLRIVSILVLATMSASYIRRPRGKPEGSEATQFALETQIIERYRRKESSVEESLMEMYLAGVSVRRVETSHRPYGA